MNGWLITMILFITISIGGGIGYMFWLLTRPKMQTWTAKCYQLGAGIVKRQVLKGGKYTGYTIRMQDLKPYTIDTLQRIEKKAGTIYRLKNQNITTQAVTSDVVDYWGKELKEVHILVIGSTATIMRKGYDSEKGEIIFNPLPRENIELISSEIITKRERYQEAKGLMASIIPWVGVGVMALALVATTYFNADSQVRTAQINAEIYEKATQVDEALAKLEAYENEKYGIKPTESTKPTDTKDPPDIK